MAYNYQYSRGESCKMGWYAGNAPYYDYQKEYCYSLASQQYGYYSTMENMQKSLTNIETSPLLGCSTSDVIGAIKSISTLSKQTKETATKRYPLPESNDQCKSADLVKPPYSYIALITMAINQAPQRKCTLRSIIEFIEDQFPFYRQNKKWHSTIRHNLTLNDCFIKAGRRLGDKGCLWTLDSAYEDMFKHGTLQRRKFRLKEGRVDKYNRNKKSTKLKQFDGKKVNSPLSSKTTSCVNANSVLAIDHTKTDCCFTKDDSGYISSDYSTSMNNNTSPDSSVMAELDSACSTLLNIPALSSDNIEWQSFSNMLQCELNIPSITPNDTKDSFEGQYNMYNSHSVKMSDIPQKAFESAIYDIPDLCGELDTASIQLGFNSGYF